MDPRKPLILLADANPSVRKQLAQPLRNEDFEVMEAPNGRDALELAERFHPEVLVLDRATPLIDGYMVCRYVKGDPQTRRLKVILMTNSGSDIPQALRAGADECVPKPVDPAELARKVRRLLTAIPPEQDGTHQRTEQRRPIKGATVSWGSRIGSRYEIMFKEPIIDLSMRGFAFEHRRCDVCTGYEKGTIHPNCPFASYARHLPKTEPLKFVLRLADKRVFEVLGKVVHVFQSPASPQTEKVGVLITEISREAAQILREFLESRPPQPVS